MTLSISQIKNAGSEPYHYLPKVTLLAEAGLNLEFWTSRLVRFSFHHAILIVLTHLGASVHPKEGGCSLRWWSRAGPHHENLGRQGLPPARGLNFPARALG